MAWRLAKSLVRLKEQIDQAYPNRERQSDGTVGDTSHQAQPSDHNPNGRGVVCALDITHSPETGFDAHALADQITENPHPDLKYIISNRRIAYAESGWQWVEYTGADPHFQHIHISVGSGYDGQSEPPYDDTNDWPVEEHDMITQEQYRVAAQAAGFEWGRDFDYDENRGMDAFVQLLFDQAPKVTKELESKVADSLSGVKNYIGWDGYNSPYVGKPVAQVYEAMLDDWKQRVRPVTQNQAQTRPTKRDVLEYLNANLK